MQTQQHAGYITYLHMHCIWYVYIHVYTSIPFSKAFVLHMWPRFLVHVPHTVCTSKYGDVMDLSPTKEGSVLYVTALEDMYCILVYTPGI